MISKAGWVTKDFFSDENLLENDHEHDENGNHILKTEVINIDSLVYEDGDTLKRPINIVVNITNDNPHENLESNGTPGTYFEGLRSNIFEMFNPSRIQEIIASLFSFFRRICNYGAICTVYRFFLFERTGFIYKNCFYTPGGQT